MGNRQTTQEELNESEEILAGREQFGPPTEILPFLYLGSAYNASDVKLLQSLNITHILNVAEEYKGGNSKEFTHLKLIIPDFAEPGEMSYIVRTWEEAFSFIEKAEAKEKKVLVHCMRGRSRSATITIGYLMTRREWTLKQSYEHVKQRREIIGPHRALCVQLKYFERKIRSLGSSTMDGEW